MKIDEKALEAAIKETGGGFVRPAPLILAYLRARSAQHLTDNNIRQKRLTDSIYETLWNQEKYETTRLRAELREVKKQLRYWQGEALSLKSEDGYHREQRLEDCLKKVLVDVQFALDK